MWREGVRESNSKMRYKATSFAGESSREITGLTSKRQSKKRRKYNYRMMKENEFCAQELNRLMEMNPFTLLFDLPPFCHVFSELFSFHFFRAHSFCELERIIFPCHYYRSVKREMVQCIMMITTVMVVIATLLHFI